MCFRVVLGAKVCLMSLDTRVFRLPPVVEVLIGLTRHPQCHLTSVPCIEAAGIWDMGRENS